MNRRTVIKLFVDELESLTCFGQCWVELEHDAAVIVRFSHYF